MQLLQCYAMDQWQGHIVSATSRNTFKIKKQIQNTKYRKSTAEYMQIDICISHQLIKLIDPKMVFEYKVKSRSCVKKTFKIRKYEYIHLSIFCLYFGFSLFYNFQLLIFYAYKKKQRLVMTMPNNDYLYLLLFQFQRDTDRLHVPFRRWTPKE